MNAKRTNLLAGTILGGALLLGTAGMVFAQDPTGPSSPSTTSGMGSGMMGARVGMMDGAGMMNGAGMMSGMDADNIASMHKAMGAHANCDPALMQTMHQQVTQSR